MLQVIQHPVYLIHRLLAQIKLILLSKLIAVRATIGTLSAQAVVNHFVYNAAEPNWSAAWYAFAAYALVVAFLFMILFKEPKDSTQKVA